jgi:hypothetical protein
MFNKCNLPCQMCPNIAPSFKLAGGGHLQVTESLEGLVDGQAIRGVEGVCQQHQGVRDKVEVEVQHLEKQWGERHAPHRGLPEGGQLCKLCLD